MAFGPSRKRGRAGLTKKRRRFARRVISKVPQSIKKYVGMAIARKEETKYVDFSATALDIGPVYNSTITSKVLYDLNIGQGSGTSNRIGAKLQLRGLKMKMQLSWTNAYTVAGGVVRILVCYFPSPPDAGAITAQNIETQSVFLGANGSPYMAIRDKGVKSVKVLKDITIKAPNQSQSFVSGGGNFQFRQKSLSVWVPMRNLPVEYVYGGSYPMKGSLAVYICSNSQGAVTDCLLTHNSRLYFKDS